ncbi:hypothetical protein RHSIM_Rhsim10G0042400 [Rhododendron simsii]|uniref:Protein DA1-like domain-containing protein n=1 Tax=Rhododendron simsii TaxID=118357 RepID=A0A834GDN4_RHOSS|nr:hypothetical protein RHSIM_Rhsim10G0042400 [Rhododendron simsii]
MLHFGQESSMENMVVRNLDGRLFRMVYKTTLQTFGVTPDHLDKKGLKFASIIRDGFWVKVGAGHLGIINGKGMELESLEDYLFVREEDLLTSLKQRLNEMVPNTNERDSLKWRWDTNAGMLTVKSCYEKWDKELNAQNYIGPHCHLIWRNICPDSIQSGDLHMASYTGLEMETLNHLLNYFMECMVKDIEVVGSNLGVSVQPIWTYALYMQPIEVDYTNLGDGRYLCPDCLPIMLMEPEQLKPIIRQVHSFFDDYLKISIRKDIPIFLIDGNEMNRNVIGAINGTPIARGKFLKRGEDTIKAVERCEWSGANLEVVTSTKKVKGDKVGAISLLFGLPRDGVAQTLVYEMAHAWIKHQGWTLEKGVEEGLCEAASYAWLKYTASDYDPSYTQKDAEIAEPLAMYIKHGMKENSFCLSAAENRKAKCTIEKYGLKRILKYVACTRNIPETYDLCSDPSYTQKDAKIAEPLATYIKHGKKEDSFSFSAAEFRKAKCTIEQYGFKRTLKYVASTRKIPDEFQKAKCTIEQYGFKRTLKYVASTRKIPETPLLRRSYGLVLRSSSPYGRRSPFISD